MKKSRFTEAKIVSILKELEAGASATELGRRHGVHPNTIGNWKQNYTGLEIDRTEGWTYFETKYFAASGTPCPGFPTFRVSGYSYQESNYTNGSIYNSPSDLSASFFQTGSCFFDKTGSGGSYYKASIFQPEGWMLVSSPS